MKIIRHPKLAEDIRSAARHYARISQRVLSSFWRELESALKTIEHSPRSHHYDSSGLRRASLRRFPYHLLYEIHDDTLFVVVFRHDKRHPGFGLDRAK